MKNAGINISGIQNKEFETIETERSNLILKALEQAGIPYFAKYDNTKIILTYDGTQKYKVDEILMKADCADKEEIEMFRSNPDSLLYAKELLPEIAEIIGISVSCLENKPKDLQILLTQTYINYWHSDSETIKKALVKEMRVAQTPEPKEYEKNLLRDKEEIRKIVEMKRFR